VVEVVKILLEAAMRVLPPRIYRVLTSKWTIIAIGFKKYPCILVAVGIVQLDYCPVEGCKTGFAAHSKLLYVALTGVWRPGWIFAKVGENGRPLSRANAQVRRPVAAVALMMEPKYTTRSHTARNMAPKRLFNAY
jgi:hypothetical protein